MKMTLLSIGATALLLTAGCGNHANNQASSTSASSTPAAVESASNATPEQLGEIGARIKKHPKEAGRILSEHGMTEASFEKAIRTVSSSPDASRRYRDAYKKAGA